MLDGNLQEEKKGSERTSTVLRSLKRILNTLLPWPGGKFLLFIKAGEQICVFNDIKPVVQFVVFFFFLSLVASYIYCLKGSKAESVGGSSIYNLHSSNYKWGALK